MGKVFIFVAKNFYLCAKMLYFSETFSSTLAYFGKILVGVRGNF